MLYMLWKISKELVRTVRMFSSWMVLAREIASAFPETARETDESSDLVSSRILLLLDVAAAFPETAASMLYIFPETLLMLDLVSSRTLLLLVC